MASLTCFIGFAFCFLVSGSEVSQNVIAEPGQTITLPCQIPKNTPVVIVEWTRPDLGTQYVLFYRDGQSDPENQSPSFKNRVGLKEGLMQDGDVSLILKDVTMDDKGTYECHIVPKETNRRKRAGSFDTEPIKIINLNVRQPGFTHDEVGLVIGVLAVALVLALVPAGVLIWRRRKGFKKATAFQSSVDEEFELKPL